jgi:hypothetical protein
MHSQSINPSRMHHLTWGGGGLAGGGDFQNLFSGYTCTLTYTRMTILNCEVLFLWSVDRNTLQLEKTFLRN